MRIGQQVVVGDQKYTFPMPNNASNFVVFDMHNDSPYNAGISFGQDTGIGNCDYFTSPHGVLTGMSPLGSSHRSVAGARWNGTIYVYTETPSGGGGSTNLSSAPASSVTVLGYPQGYQPQGQVSLNRMQTTANTVNTSGNMASTSVQNDNNPASTDWAEATQSGGPASNVVGTVDGSIQFNQWDGTTKKLLFQTIANAAVNNPSIKALAAGMFMEIVGSLLIDQNLTIANNEQLQWKDNGGTARRVMQVDNNDNTQLFGIAGLDLIQMLSSGGVLGIIFDMINKSLDIKTTAVNLPGTTAGSAQLYMPFTGTNFKLAILIFNAYQNNTATEQTIALPVAFSTRCNWLAGNGKPTRPYSSGVALTGKVNVNNNGTATSGNTVNSNNMGEIIQGFDSLGLGTNEASQASAIYFFVGN